MPTANPITSAVAFQPITGPLLMAALFPNEEIWAPIAGFSAYRVSSFGRVASFFKSCRVPGYRKFVQTVMESPQRFLKVTHNRKRKYLYFDLAGDDCVRSSHQVGNWMLRAFVGTPGLNMECCHRDGNPYNNVLENLRWGSRSVNIFDRVIHGTHNTVKLNPEQAGSIRERANAGESCSSLAREFGMNRTTIYDIKNGTIWRKLTPLDDPRQAP